MTAFHERAANGYNAEVLRRTIMALMLLVSVTACNSAPVKLKPAVDVISPPDGAKFAPGEQIDVRVAAASSSLVARIEVHVDGVLAVSQDNPSPSQTVTALLRFVPTQAGSVRLTVTAMDATGTTSDPVSITVIIGSVSYLQDVISPTVGTGGSASGPPGTSSCKLAATYVTDVTIPDNTPVSAGSSLVKTWRVRNTSDCAWENGYQLSHDSGDQMGAPTSVPVPPTARDATVDISVPFTAPSTPGIYTTTWRMHAPDGTDFGNRVFMVIRVP